MIDKRQQPIRFLTNYIQPLFPDAIIAGGAIRDHYFNILPRDYDIFISLDAYNWVTVNEDKIRQLCNMTRSNDTFMDYVVERFNCDVHSQNSNYGDATFSNKICYIYDVCIDGHPIQLIFLSSDIKPVDYVHQYFDVGLCKAFCDGKRVHYINEFLQDVTNKTLTITYPIDSLQKLVYILDHHVLKLRQKFPTYKLQLGGENEQRQEYIDVISRY